MASQTRQRALITGASSGIGRATAIAFAQADMDLALVSRSQEKLKALSETLRHSDRPEQTIRTYTLDLSQLAQIRSSMQAILEDFGPVDILVNNAGMGYTAPLSEMSLADWQQVMDLNLTSVFLCTQTLLPSMRKRQRGTILNVGSIAAHNAFPTWGAYSAGKAALITLSRILAAEEREHGIRVMIVSPGAVNTPLWDTETVHANFEKSQMLSPDVVAQAILNAVCLPEAAAIDELILTPSGGAL